MSQNIERYDDEGNLIEVIEMPITAPGDLIGALFADLRAGLPASARAILRIQKIAVVDAIAENEWGEVVELIQQQALPIDNPSSEQVALFDEKKQQALQILGGAALQIT